MAKLSNSQVSLHEKEVSTERAFEQVTIFQTFIGGKQFYFS